MSKTVAMLRSNPVNPDSRVEKEVATLAQNGYKVIIVCWDRDENYKVEENTFDEFGTRIIKFGIKASFGDGIKNLKQFLKFQLRMRKWLKKNRKSYDAVHACDFDTAYFTRKIAKKYKKIFIFDVFDFICGDGKGFVHKYVKKAQFKIINNASATIICTEDRVNQIKGTNPKNLTIIHNSPFMIDSQNGDGKDDYEIKVVYVGILCDVRLLKEEAEVFTRNPKWKFTVAGFGMLEEYFKDMASKYNNIEFLGKISYKETLELESKADIMLAVYEPNIENHKFAAPNKFYEGLMLGKPLIMVKGTGMSNVVSENGIGTLIDYSGDSFEIGIKELISKREEWPNMANKMKDIYLKEFDWRIMQQRLLNLYKKLFEEK